MNSITVSLTIFRLSQQAFYCDPYSLLVCLWQILYRGYTSDAVLLLCVISIRNEFANSLTRGCKSLACSSCNFPANKGNLLLLGNTFFTLTPAFLQRYALAPQAACVASEGASQLPLDYSYYCTEFCKGNQIFGFKYLGISQEWNAL